MSQFSIEVFLPSGREDVSIGQVLCSSMRSLYNAVTYKQPRVLVRELAKYVSVDLESMLLEDFRYLLAMFDRTSWTESHRMYEWRCTSVYHLDADGYPHLAKPLDRRTRPVDCNMLNTEEVPNARVITQPMRTLPEGFHHPRVSHYLDYCDLRDEYGDLAEYAMWIASDTPLAETLQHVSLEQLAQAKGVMYSICDVETKLKCNRCMREYTIHKPLDILSFLRVYNDKAMMDMALNLSTVLNIYMPDDAPLSKLLYWHSCYVKDKAEAEEAKRVREAQKGRQF